METEAFIKDKPIIIGHENLNRSLINNFEFYKALQFNLTKDESIKSTKLVLANKLIKKNKISLTEDYVKDWISSNNDEETAKKLLNEDYESYCNQIKWSYIVDDIIDSNKIKVENSEIEEMAKNQIQHH